MLVNHCDPLLQITQWAETVTVPLGILHSVMYRMGKQVLIKCALLINGAATLLQSPYSHSYAPGLAQVFCHFNHRPHLHIKP